MQVGTSQTVAAVYPRVYRPTGFWKLILLLCSIVAVCGGGAGIWFAMVGQFNALSQRVVMAVALGSFFFLGVYMLLWLFRSRVVLFEDRISVEDLISTKVFSRDGLRGWRVRPTSPPYLILQPKDKHLRVAKIALIFPLDDEFREWLDVLPPLDSQDAEASEATILEDERLGASPSVRSQVLVEGKNRAKVLSLVSLAVILWAIFYPKPYLPLMLVLAMLPWVAVAIVWKSDGLFRVDELKNDAHPSVAPALIFPGLALTLRAILDFDILQSGSAFAIYLVIGGVLAVAIFLADPISRRRKSSAIAFCALALAYGYGASIQCNVLLDKSPGIHCTAVVQGEHINHGKRISYVVELGPWGPKIKTSELDVRKATYESIRPGDIAELTLRKGALGISWYYLTAWEHGDDCRALTGKER